MSSYRPIKTKIWHDSWFLTLSSEEKLLWLFLLTNDYAHISGIYELPHALIKPLTGLDNCFDILKKFEKEGKIKRHDNYIFICNYLKNQTKQINKRDNIIRSIISHIKENPSYIEWFNLLEYEPYNTLISPSEAPSKQFTKPKEVKKKEESPPEDYKSKEVVVSPGTKDEVTLKSSGNYVNDLLGIFTLINPELNFAHKTHRKVLAELVDKYNFESVKGALVYAVEIQLAGDKYAPVITTPIELRKKLGQLSVYARKKGKEKQQVVDINI